MPTRQTADHGPIVAADRHGRERGGPPPQTPPPVLVQAVGYLAAAWCVGFAGVSVWQLAAGPIGPPGAPQRYAADAAGLTVMVVLVGLLKLAGAAVALAAVLVRRTRSRRLLQMLGVALWGTFGLLALYSAGNLIITVGTLSGLLIQPLMASTRSLMPIGRSPVPGRRRRSRSSVVDSGRAQQQTD